MTCGGIDVGVSCPEERHSSGIRFGPDVMAFLAWRDDGDGGEKSNKKKDKNKKNKEKEDEAARGGRWSYETFALAEAPYGEWTTLRGVVEVTGDMAPALGSRGGEGRGWTPTSSGFL